MVKKYCFALLAAAAFTTPVFADDDMTSNGNKACETIVKACLDAGYSRDSNGDKQFWQNCMHPVLLGKTAEGVTIDAATVKSCRTAKIKEMTNELAELKKANKK